MGNKKRRGFTLIELLAVIIILAIIALICIPVVSKVVEEASFEAFKTGIKNSVKVTESDCNANNMKNDNFPDVVFTEHGVDHKLNIKGKLPTNGTINVDENCNTRFTILNNDKYCAVKATTSSKIGFGRLKDNRCEVSETEEGSDEEPTKGYACSDKSVTPTSSEYFVFDKDTGTIQYYQPEGPKDVIIPCSIEGVEVTKIGPGAFSGKELNSVMFNDQITDIGYYGFQRNKLTKVELPDSIVNVADNAFQDNQIKELRLSEGMNTINSATFKNNKINYIKIPNSIKIVYYEAFKDNNSVAVDFGTGLEKICSAAFYGNNFTDIIFPDSLKTIESSGFISTSTEFKLNSLVFGKGMTDYGTSTFGSSVAPNLEINKVVMDGNNFEVGRNGYSRVFSGSNVHIKDVIIKSGIKMLNYQTFISNTIDNITFEEGVSFIGDQAFAGAKGFKTIKFPNSLRKIDNLAFRGTDLEEIEFNDGLEEIGGYSFIGNKLKNVTIPDSVTKIGDHVFSAAGNYIEGIDDMNTVVIGKGLASLGGYMFYYKKINNLIIDGNKETFYSGNFYKVNNLTIKGSPILENYAFIDAGLEKVTIDSKGYTIKEGAFAVNPLSQTKYIYKATNGVVDNTVLVACGTRTGDNITIPSTVTRIGNYSFSNNEFNSIIIPSHVKEIGGYALSASKNITEVRIPKTVEKIGTYAFNGSTNLETIYLADGIRLKEAGPNWQLPATNVIFEGDSKEHNCYYMDGDTLTGYNTLCGGDVDLTTVNSPIKKIGNEAFKNQELSSLKLKEGIEEIGNGAFSGAKFDLIELPSTLKKIGDSAFYNTSFTSINLPNGLEEIGKNAFDAADITSINVPGTVKTIGEYAFWNNYNLTRAVINEGVTTLGDYVFWNTKLNFISLPSSLTSIGYNILERLTNVNISVADGRLSGIPFGATSYTVTYRDTINLNIVSGLDIVPVNYNSGSIPRYVELEFKSTNPLRKITSLTVNGIKYTGNKIITTSNDINITNYEYEEVSEFVFETSHPYENSLTKEETLTFPNSQGLMITFNNSSKTETGYDYVYIYEGNSSSYKYKLSGTEMASKSYIVNSDTIKIKFTSDGSTSYYGIHATIRPLETYTVSFIGNASSGIMIDGATDNKVLKGSTVIFRTTQVGRKITSITVNGNKIAGDSVVADNNLVVSDFESEEVTEKIFETPHPYDNSYTLDKTYRFAGATSIKVVLDANSYTEKTYDTLKIYDKDNVLKHTLSGTIGGNYYTISGDTVRLVFSSDSSQTEWGIKATVSPFNN